MPKPYRRLAVAAFATTTLFALFTISALVKSPSVTARNAQRSGLIDTYAITNARIVPVSGQVIERGLIVIRNGLIEVVNEHASTPPADARVIDGSGLTVYPGLIDANTNLGIPPPSSAQSARSPGAGGTPAVAPPPPSQGPSSATPAAATALPDAARPLGFHPETLAADLIRPGGDQIEAWRSSGITTALAAPRDGIFAGQSAVINLAGETPPEMIVRSPIALHVFYAPFRTGLYPSSLMGVTASMRQMLLDAEQLREVNRIYRENPRGLRRPEPDRSLAALAPVLARELPIVIYADRAREITRALDLAEEFKLQLIIAGGADAWMVTDRLRAMNVPVLLSLNFPRRTAVQVPEASPDSLRVLRERADAPKAAGRLAQAGVRFAFQSGGMQSIADFLSNATRSVENNLSPDEALRAMTLRAAEILGVADRLGSIEPGKIANLVVTRGNLFDRARQIRYVFIDGRPVDLKPAPGPAASRTTTIAASGTWTLRVSAGENQEQSATLALEQQGERLSGSIQGELGSAPIANASINTSGEIRFTVPVTIGGQTTEAVFSGTLPGPDEMRGTVQIVGRGQGTFTGTRSPQARVR